MSQDEQVEEQQVEEKAIRQGWNPDYDGPNKKSAEQFLEDGEKIAAISKERNEKLMEDNASMKKQLEDVTGSVQKLEKFYREQSEKKVAAEIARLKSDRADAISEGDGQLVNDIDDKIDDLKSASREEEPEKKTTDPTPAFGTWLEKNTWYQEDEDLALEADIIAQQIINTGRIKDETKLYAQVEQRIKRAFPEKFENPNRKEHGMMEASTRSGKSDEKTYADLPPDAKKACDDFVSTIPGFKKEDYVAAYQFED